jgi:hypothetical protein
MPDMDSVNDEDDRNQMTLYEHEKQMRPMVDDVNNDNNQGLVQELPGPFPIP